MFCKRIVKWTLIGAVGVGATGFLLFGNHAFSYLSTAANSIRNEVNGQIPIEFELKRAEALIGEIEPQIEDGKRQVAQAEVELENLESEVARLEHAVQRGESKLRNVSAKAGATTVDGPNTLLASYRGYRVELDLERTFETFKNNSSLLEGKRALIERQAKAVTVARMHLDAVRAEKARLEDTISMLKTQKQRLDAMAASSRNLELDDTALGKAKEVLAQVKKRLDVQQRLIEDEIFFESDEVDDHGAPRQRRDIVTEIQAFFADESAEASDCRDFGVESDRPAR